MEEILPNAVDFVPPLSTESIASREMSDGYDDWLHFSFYAGHIGSHQSLMVPNSDDPYECSRIANIAMARIISSDKESVYHRCS